MKPLVLVLVLLGSAAAADEPADRARSAAVTNEGLKLYDVGDFDGAILKFEEAYRIFPLPNILYDLGQAHRQKKDYEPALFYYRSYLRNKPQASNRATVESLIQELEETIASAPRAPAPRPASAPAPQPPPVEERWYDDTIGWIVVGAGAAAAGVGAGFLIHASSQSSESTETLDQMKAIELNDSARRSRTIGAVLVGIGGAVAVGGIVKMLLHDGSTAEAPSTAVAVGPGWVAVAGRF